MDLACSEALSRLVVALEDPAPEVGGAAAAALANMRSLRALPALTRLYADPNRNELHAAAESAIRQIVEAEAGLEAPAPSPRAAEALRRRIEAVADGEPGAWPVRAATSLGALPVHSSSALYLWALQPDGAVVCLAWTP